MIEMLVVLAILGVVLAISLARGPWHSDTVEVRAAADAIADALRRTRALAWRTDQPQSCRVEPSLRAVLPAHAARVRLGRSVDVSPATVVTFGPDGGASGGSIRVSAGRAVGRVDVDWLSGRIAVVAR